MCAAVWASLFRSPSVCVCVCARPTANDLRHRQSRGRGEEGLATQRPQIARLWQLRAMDNLNGLKGYVRLASAWDAATTVAASSASAVVSRCFFCCLCSALCDFLAACRGFWLRLLHIWCQQQCSTQSDSKIEMTLAAVAVAAKQRSSLKKHSRYLIVCVLEFDFTMIKEIYGYICIECGYA